MFIDDDVSCDDGVCVGDDDDGFLTLMAVMIKVLVMMMMMVIHIVKMLIPDRVMLVVLIFL